MSETSWTDRLGSAATSTLAGVAGGAMLGPPGMIVGGLVGLARSLTSQPHADDEAPALQQVAQALTGVADPQQQVAALQADPVKADEFRVAALRIRAEAETARQALLLGMMQAANEDRAGARGHTLELAKAGSAISWGAPIVSVVLLLMFGAVLALVLLRGLPEGVRDIALVLLGTLGTMATQVPNYWLGSSAGSSRKTDLLASERERR